MKAAPALRDLARRLSLGRAALTLYHRPVGLVRQSIAEGGPWEQRRTEMGRREMMEAARALQPFDPPAVDLGARVVFLSGAQYWYQTLFCFASLQRQMPERVTPVIHDDGTLAEETRALLRRVVPWVEFIDCALVNERLDRLLPAASYPSLRDRRLKYFHLRKLTDIHVCASGWTLVMDSDMLCFRRPDALLAWFRRPHATFMQDVHKSYGYSDELMSALATGPVPERVNVGLYAVHSPSIDWARVEYNCSRQIEQEGPHYLQEQALTALVLSGFDAKPLPEADYVVMPPLAEGRTPRAVFHHYVAQSKRSYFQHGWRHVVKLLESRAGLVRAHQSIGA